MKVVVANICLGLNINTIHPENEAELNTEANDLISRNLCQWHNWEPYETELFIEVLNKCRNTQDVVVDIGTQLGYYTLIASKLGYKVYSFECNPVYLEQMKKSVDMNDLSPVVTTLTRVNETCPMRDIIKEEVGILKADIEGAEPEAIQSVMYLFQQRTVKYAFIEISPHLRVNGEYLKLTKDIQACGYKVYDIGISPPRDLSIPSSHLSTLTPMSDDIILSRSQEREQTNYLFIRDDL